MSLLMGASNSINAIETKMSACILLHVILGSSKEKMLTCQTTYQLVIGQYELLKSLTTIFVEYVEKYIQSTSEITNERIKECIDFLMKLSGDKRVYHSIYPPSYEMKHQ